jgi:hypothetical protein
LRLWFCQISKEEQVEISEDAPEGPPWKIEESVWATRPKETDSRDFWDNEKVYEKGHVVDWTKLQSKEKFMNFLDREANKHKTKKTPEEVRGMTPFPRARLGSEICYLCASFVCVEYLHKKIRKTK